VFFTDWLTEGATMCLWAVRHIRFEGLSAKQKSDLKKKLQQRKQAVQARLKEVSLALAHVKSKSKGRSSGRGRRR
jgi:hypothetical protein